MITSLYPIIGTRDLRSHVDAAKLLEIRWRDGVKRNVAARNAVVDRNRPFWGAKVTEPMIVKDFSVSTTSRFTVIK